MTNLIEATAKTVRPTFTKTNIIIVQAVLLLAGLFIGIRMFRSNYVLVNPIVKIDNYISQIDAQNYRAQANQNTTTPISHNCINNPDLCIRK